MRPPATAAVAGYRPEKHYPVKKDLFSGTAGKALDGVSFNLERGKTLAVVGSPVVENPHWAAC